MNIEFESLSKLTFFVLKNFAENCGIKFIHGDQTEDPWQLAVQGETAARAATNKETTTEDYEADFNWK